MTVAIFESVTSPLEALLRWYESADVRCQVDFVIWIENTRSVKGIQPRDQAEAMLAAQMAAVTDRIRSAA